MKLRHLVVAPAAASLLALGAIGAMPASAGTSPGLLATPSPTSIGHTVTITHAPGAECGGQEGDPAAVVDISVLKPDGTTETDVEVNADSEGDWSYEYTTTDQLGTYDVAATCNDAEIPQGLVRPLATDFDYADTTFVVQAATTTTAAPTTTAAAAAAVAAAPAFTG